MPRVVVFGYDELLLAHLDVLAEVGARVVAVVFPHSRTNARARAVRSQVQQRGLPTLEQPGAGAAADFAAAIRAFAPDLILCWSYPLVLPPQITALPARGSLNLHFGLLPQYRGGSAFRWAVANGELETGVTLHEMAAAPDAGPILGIERVGIADADEIADVMRNLRAAGETLLRRMWPRLADGTAPRTPQDAALAGTFPVWTDDDSRIDWRHSNRAIRNLVRSLGVPFSGATTTFDGIRLTVAQAECVDIAPDGARPGTIVARAATGPVVACGEGGLVLQKVRRLDSADTRPLSIGLGKRFRR